MLLNFILAADNSLQSSTALDSAHVLPLNLVLDTRLDCHYPSLKTNLGTVLPLAEQPRSWFQNWVWSGGKQHLPLVGFHSTHNFPVLGWLLKAWATRLCATHKHTHTHTHTQTYTHTLTYRCIYMFMHYCCYSVCTCICTYCILLYQENKTLTYLHWHNLSLA